MRHAFQDGMNGPGGLVVRIDHRIADDSQVLCWECAHHRYRGYINISNSWVERGCGVYELMNYICRLIGGVIQNLDQSQAIGIEDALHALHPTFERSIAAQMDREEMNARMMRDMVRFIDATNYAHPNILFGNPGQRDYWAANAWARRNSIPQESPANLQAKRKATELLLSQLQPDQRESFERDKTFKVRAKDGKTYTISHARSFNVTGPDGVRYCGQTVDTPIEDQMLAQKLLLEHEPEKFFANTNRMGGAPRAGDNLVLGGLLDAMAAATAARAPEPRDTIPIRRPVRWRVPNFW